MGVMTPQWLSTTLKSCRIDQLLGLKIAFINLLRIVSWSRHSSKCELNRSSFVFVCLPVWWRAACGRSPGAGRWSWAAADPCGSGPPWPRTRPSLWASSAACRRWAGWRPPRASRPPWCRRPPSAGCWWSYPEYSAPCNQNETQKKNNWSPHFVDVFFYLVSLCFQPIELVLGLPSFKVCLGGFTGFHSVVLDCTEFLPSFIWLDHCWTEFYLVFRFSLENNWVSFCFSGLYRVLPSFVGVIWLDHCFTEFYLVLRFALEANWVSFCFYSLFSVLPSFIWFDCLEGIV